MEIAANAESIIDPTWRQKIAASWSITWPSLLASFVLIGFVTGGKSFSELENDLASLGLLANVSYLAGQVVLIPRLVRKRYRSFRIFVVRDGHTPVRSVSFSETLRIWFQIVWPQAIFLVGTSHALSVESSNFSPETLRSLSFLGLWLRILVIGPAAIQVAMSARYKGFRLQAYGWRLI